MLCSSLDTRNLTSLLASLRRAHPEWFALSGGRTISSTYDGKSAVFTSGRLPFTALSENNEPFHSEDVLLDNLDGMPSKKQYRVRALYS